MAHNPELLYKRNLKIHERFRYHRKRNPKWQYCYVLQAVAQEFYLSDLTVQRILKNTPAEPVTQLEIQFG